MSANPGEVRKFVLWTVWPLIVLAVLALALGGFMWAFMVVIMPPEVLDDMRRDPVFAMWPGPLWDLLKQIPLLLEITLVTAVLSLVICVGVLFGSRTAYWGLIVSFWLGALANVAGIIWHWRFIDAIHPALEQMAAQFGLEAAAGYWTTQLSGLMFGLVFAVGFGWTAWRLQSPPYLQHWNFKPTQKASTSASVS